MLKRLDVLVGNHEAKLTALILDLLKRGLVGRYTVHGTSCETVEEARELTLLHDFDLFVLVVNNVFFKSDGPLTTLEQRFGPVIELITCLKDTRKKPVVAFSGYHPQGSLPRLEAAGADVVLALPFEPHLFVELVEVCLEGG